MFFEIVTHTPSWVWVTLALLIAAGASQLRDRELSLARVTVLPMALLVLSAAGVLSVFGSSTIAVGAWLAGLAASVYLGRAPLAPRGAIWVAARNRLQVPGSWVPLALMLGLFAIKYAAGTARALHPELSSDPSFGAACGLAYGLFAGLFLGRALALRSLAGNRAELRTA